MTTCTERTAPADPQRIGYGRVSTQDQNLALQFDALRQAGCHKIYTDKISGAKSKRPALYKALAKMKAGDTLVIWKLSRLGRSVVDLSKIAMLLRKKGIHLWSLQENIDTNTAAGNLLFNVLAAFAQFDRDTIVENTVAGLAAARARGRVGGRRRLAFDDRIKAELRAELADRMGKDVLAGMAVDRICAALSMSRASYYRYREELKIEPQLFAEN